MKLYGKVKSDRDVTIYKAADLLKFVGRAFISGGNDVFIIGKNSSGDIKVVSLEAGRVSDDVEIHVREWIDIAAIATESTGPWPVSTYEKRKSVSPC